MPYRTGKLFGRFFFGILIVILLIALSCAGYHKFFHKKPISPRMVTYSTDNRFEDAFIKPNVKLPVNIWIGSYFKTLLMIKGRKIPSKQNIWPEDFINYFQYDYSPPTGNEAFSIKTELGISPWNRSNKLLFVSIQGKRTILKKSKSCNMVLILDISGSMYNPPQLPLIKEIFNRYLPRLGYNDSIAVVTYAGGRHKLLPTQGRHKSRIISFINKPSDEYYYREGTGSIQLAYKFARKQYRPTAANTVVLLTDGDTGGIGAHSQDLSNIVRNGSKKGISFIPLHFNTSTFHNSSRLREYAVNMQELARAGKGRYTSVRHVRQGLQALKRICTGQISKPIADDMSARLEFNPSRTAAYRLIGHESGKDCRRDARYHYKWGNEIFSGHDMTALYEIIPPGGRLPNCLRIKRRRKKSPVSTNKNLAKLIIQYRKPGAKKTITITRTIADKPLQMKDTSNDFRFASAVGAFGMILHGSRYRGRADLRMVYGIAKKAKGLDRNKERSEFIKLIQKARIIGIR